MKIEKLKIKGKLFFNKILNYFISFPIKLLLNNEIGRSILFNSFPLNNLIMCNTEEGIKYIVNSSDKTIGRGTFKSQKSFDSKNLEQSLQILNIKKSILLDIGANIGTIGIYGIFKKHFDKCLAFEPEPKNFSILKYNIFINELADKFEIFNIALNDGSQDNLLIRLSKDNFGDHRSYHSTLSKENNKNEIIVPCNTLNKICENLNLDEVFIFMDTQGFEGHILSGARKLIDYKVPIVTEFWPYGLRKANCLEKFYESLADSKYQNLYNLRFPNKRIKFSIKALKIIASEMGDDLDIFTDLLIF